MKLKELYPNIKEINIKVLETNAWPWNRLREFGFSPESEFVCHLDCPMSKCLGVTSGIEYRETITNMIYNHEKFRQERLSCGGYGGYNFTFHCDWFVVLAVSITYYGQ